MNPRRWLELAAALLLGVLIGVPIGHSVAPSARYRIGPYGQQGLYRYDIHTGKAWLSSGAPRPGELETYENHPWIVIQESKASSPIDPYADPNFVPGQQQQAAPGK